MFQGIKCVVQGADHIAKNKICQDAAGYWSTENYGVAVVADGHGSDKYIRSDIGSKKAVEAAIETVKTYMADFEKFAEAITKNAEYVLDRMKEYFFACWTQAVEDYHDQNPLNEEEKAILEKAKAENISFYTYYGSTILIAVMAEKFCYGLLVGDGGFVLVDAKGEVRIPIEDENSRANYTSSICSRNAISAMNAFFEESRPVSMCVSTDGLIKSFGSEADFKDYHVLLSTMLTNMENCQASLNKNLDKRTKSGSGDDISVSIVFDSDRVAESQALLRGRIEQNKMQKKAREEQQRLDMIKFQKEQERQRRKSLLDAQESLDAEIRRTRSLIEESISKEKRAMQQLEEMNNLISREQQERQKKLQYLNELETKKQQRNQEQRQWQEKWKKLQSEEEGLEKTLEGFLDAGRRWMDKLGRKIRSDVRDITEIAEQTVEKLYEDDATILPFVRELKDDGPDFRFEYRKEIDEILEYDGLDTMEFPEFGKPGHLEFGEPDEEVVKLIVEEVEMPERAFGADMKKEEFCMDDQNTESIEGAEEQL